MEYQKFNSLFLEYSKIIYNLGLRLFFFSIPDAEDFTQEVYLHASEKIYTIKDEQAFKSWVYQLALNYGLNKIKEKKKEVLIPDKFLEEKVNMTYIDSNPNIEKILDTKEIQYYIDMELQKMPKIYQLLLTLYYYEGMKYKTISTTLNMKLGTTKSYLKRAKEMLKYNLTKHGISL